MTRDSTGEFGIAAFLFGAALGFALGIVHALLSVSSTESAATYFRGLIFAVILLMLASAVSWLARLVTVGRFSSHMEGTLSIGTRSAVFFLSSANFGLFCLSLPLLTTLIIGLLFGWKIGEVLGAFIWILLTVAALGALRGAILEVALIIGRRNRRGCPPTDGI
jgi:hypothetical protein